MLKIYIFICFETQAGSDYIYRIVVLSHSVTNISKKLSSRQYFDQSYQAIINIFTKSVSGQTPF